MTTASSEATRVTEQGETRRRLVIWMGVIAGAMALIGTATTLISRWGDLPSGISAMVFQLGRLLYPNAEGNLWTFYSAVALTGLALAFAGIWLVLRRTGNTGGRVFVLLAAVALALAIDEATQIHENFALMSAALGLSIDFTYDWLIIGVPLAIAVGGVLLWVTRRIDRTLRIRLIVAGSVYLFGAAVLEAVCGAIATATDVTSAAGAALAYDAVMMLEEGFEFAGVLIALAAALAVFEVRGGEGDVGDRGGELTVRVRRSVATASVRPGR